MHDDLTSMQTSEDMNLEYTLLYLIAPPPFNASLESNRGLMVLDFLLARTYLQIFLCMSHHWRFQVYKLV